MRITTLVLAALVSLAGCEGRHHEHRREHRRDEGDYCFDDDDCEGHLACLHVSPESDPDHEGICGVASSPTPAPNPCGSTASITIGGVDPCAPPADGGP
jgi:hypothetical protein